LGCGRGNILESLTQCPHKVGVEISDEERAVATSKGLTVHSGNVRTYRDGRQYDVVIASEVIEHLLRPEQLWETVRCHLNSGGIFIMTCPNGFGLWEMQENHFNLRRKFRNSNLVRSLRGRAPYVRGDGADHCQWFTMKRILMMARDAGFSLIEQQNSDFMTGSPSDLALADKLPCWAASGWYFSFRYASNPPIGS
jgi:trans-aconitate methyltransferase